ncbi:MAG: hypothetical protein ACREME_12710 [Gemmatimonadales bacterium]
MTAPRVVLVALLTPAPLAAQDAGQSWFGGTAAQEIINSRLGDGHERLTGIVLSAEGQFASGPLVVRLRYGEGRVTGGVDESVIPRELVEGEALVGLRLASWLMLGAGPNARAYTAAGTEHRWLFWSAHATARGTLLPGRMASFVEVWKSFSGNVTEPAGTASGRGAEGGLELRLGGARGGHSFWGRLAYRIEHGLAGGRRETVETVAFSIGYVPPR